MKITDYGKVTSLANENVFILDGPNGTKGILASDLAQALLNILPVDNLMDVIKGELAPEMHRNIFRGKYLGSSVTAAQKAAIRAGTFDDLYAGDYWTIGDVNWRIVDINYWMCCGDIDFTTPHLVIMPDVPLYKAKMNETDITTGGYAGSAMHTTNLEQAKTTIANAFGDMVLTHREYLTNAVTNGYPSGCSWYDSTVELPNEIMMYGTHILTPAGDGTVVPSKYTVNKSQLALFKLVPKFINNRQWFWLRDVVSVKHFADAYYVGTATRGAASTSTGVRPVFPIG